MAAMSVAQRTQVWRGIMRYFSRLPDGHADKIVNGINKYDLYNPNTDTGMVADTDNWIDTHSGNTGNTTGYNGSLAVNVRTNLTASQKTIVFVAVACARQHVDLLKSVLGTEVD